MAPGGTALVLAGGGVRVAWQAGVVQALDEAGISFDHGDGTSGGILTLGMLMSGVAPAGLVHRWRTLPVRRFVSFLPLREYLRSPTSWPAMGSAGGIVEAVLPHLGVDVAAIAANTSMSGSFNVADFDAKRCVAIPHHEIDLDRLVAGVSLPIFMPAVASGGRTWTDAVWIKDANLLDSVRRGCTELWLVWCIANTPYWGDGALEQYVHMIELAANGGLHEELAVVADVNERRRRGEAVHGTTEEVRLHVVTPRLPLPLDPYFLSGRISAETLVAMGYRDAWRYLATADPAGVDLAGEPTATPAAPLGVRLALRASGPLRPSSAAGATSSAGPAAEMAVRMVVELSDLAACLDGYADAGLVGVLEHPRWGYRLLRAGRVVEEPGPPRRVRLAAEFLVDGEVYRLGLVATLHGTGPGRWKTASQLTAEVSGPGDDPGSVVATGTLRVSALEAIRAAWAVEPSGAHDLGGRVRAVRGALAWLRR